MSSRVSLALSVSDVKQAVVSALREASRRSERSGLDGFLSVCLAEPVPMRIRALANRSQANSEYVEQWVWFVTMGDPQSVFLDELSGQFGVCWGPDQHDGHYDDLGYRSPDPVEMFDI